MVWLLKSTQSKQRMAVRGKGGGLVVITYEEKQIHWCYQSQVTHHVFVGASGT